MEKNRQSRKSVIRVGFILIMMALAAGVLMLEAWRSYEEKMEILCVTLEQQGKEAAPIDIAAGLLKGQLAADAQDVRQDLEKYGFGAGFADRYQKSLYRSWAIIIMTVCFVSAVYWTLFYLMNRKQKAVRKQELLWLQGKVTALRDGAPENFQTEKSCMKKEADKNLHIESSAENDAAGNQTQYILEECDEDLGRFLMEFTALEDSIALVRRQARMEREEMKALVTDISHQLKTPVAALKTSFEILQSGNLSETEYQEFLGRCSIQILRLEELVSALINISRMETGMIAIRKVEQNLFDTILLAVNRIYPRAEEKGIEIALEAEEDLQQLKVLHDPRWLCEAILNVLENAVKYSADQTKITIRMIQMMVYLRIEIEDEGIGIPGNEWNKIFQRFYRGRALCVQEENGSGVGLYLAREIVLRHNGTLTVTACRHGKQGSCFVFQIPYL